MTLVNNEEDDFEYEFSEEEIKLFEARRAKRLSGESKTYNWQEAKDMITGKKKPLEDIIARVRKKKR